MSYAASSPTLAGFISFIQNVMDNPTSPAGVGNPSILPLDSPVIPIAYQVALMIVNPGLCQVPGPPQQVTPAVSSLYAFAVYNLAGSNLINYAQDQSGRTYFRELRAELSINKFSPGLIAGTSDQGSASSLLNQEFMKSLTLANLQYLKDPFGRAYLQIAQSAGPTVWGLS